MSYQSTVALPDALDAMERNIRAVIKLAGYTPGAVSVRVDYRGGTASVVHTRQAHLINCTVNFPAVVSTYRLTKQELDRWTGYFIHEVCHPLFTDDKTWNLACREGLQYLVNAMEDIRIEYKLNDSHLLSNSFEMLNALMSWAVFKGKDVNPNDAKSFPWAVAAIGRKEVNGYKLPGLAKMLSKVTPNTRKLLDIAFNGIRNATCTLDILKVARAISGRDPETGLRNPEPEIQDVPGLTDQPSDKPKPGEDKGDKGEEGEEGEEGGSGAVGEDEGEEGEEGGSGAAGEDEGEEGEAGEDEGEEGEEGGSGAAGKAGKAGEDEGEEGEKGEGEGEGEGEIEGGSGENPGDGGKPLSLDAITMNPVEISPVSTEMEKAAKELKKQGKEKTKIESIIVDMLRSSSILAEQPLRGFDPAYDGRPLYVPKLTENTMKCGTLRQQVSRVIKSVETESWERNRPTGRINRFALSRIGAGVTENVYCKRSIEEGYETEIVVICDGSGSMGSGSKLELCATLALAIAQACETQAVACEVVQFSASGLRVIKTPKQRASMVLPIFGRMMMNDGGGTPLSETILTMARKLSRRAPTKRKLIFSITDGQCDFGDYAVQRVCDHAEAMQVEMVGLVMDAPLHGGFKHEVAVRSSSDVASVGLGVLVKALEGRRI